MDDHSSITVLDGPPFSATEFAERTKRVQTALVKHDLEGILIIEPENICYLTGYETNGTWSTIFLFVSASGEQLFFGRHLDIGNLVPLLPNLAIKEYQAYEDSIDPTKSLADLLTRHGYSKGRIGLENGPFCFPLAYDATDEQLHTSLRDALPNVTFVDAGLLVEQVRIIKSSAEIECHRKAAQISIAGMKAGIARAREGIRDSQVAGAALAGLAEAGTGWCAVWPFVRCGPQTGRGHASWQNATWKAGTPMTMELSGVWKRYHSPVYRTLLLRPSEELRHVAKVVQTANRTGITAMGPGQTAHQAYQVFRKVIIEEGYDKLMRHRNGYSVGIAFAPNWRGQRYGVDIMEGNQRVLMPGMVFHVPTFLCLVNAHGVGQSHSIVITETGNEVLTSNLEDGPFILD